MEWFHWLLIAVVVVWVACSVVNYILLKKLGADVVIQGEGGFYWVLFAPLWVIPIYLSYREYKRNNRWRDDLDHALKEIRTRHDQRVAEEDAE